MEWFRLNTVGASLADQRQDGFEPPADAAQIRRLAAHVSRAMLRPDTLAIALGANLPSPAGEPAATLEAVKPLLQELLQELLQRWIAAADSEANLAPSTSAVPDCRWSPLLRTAPVGGPAGQSDYLNGVVVVQLPAGCSASRCWADQTATQAAVKAAARSERFAVELLLGLQRLEARFGRPPLRQRQHWGPRSLDLDLLWWGDLRLDLPATLTQPALQLPHPRWRERSFVVEPLAALVSAEGMVL